MGIYNFTHGTPNEIIKCYTRLTRSPDELIAKLASRALTSAPRRQLPDWKGILYQTVDGRGLQDAPHGLKPKWIDAGTKLMKGGTYINAVKTRLGILTTPARSARGRDVSGRCDLGCPFPGTLHHILQICPAVQPWRIKRHDSIKELVQQKLCGKGYNTVSEPRISTPEGLRKPDLVVWNEERSYVIDVQVTADSNVNSIDVYHQEKIRKYDKPAIKSYVESRTGKEPTIESITCNWRGVTSRQTSLLCRELGLSTADLELISIRALSGANSIYCNYMGMSGGGDVT